MLLNASRGSACVGAGGEISCVWHHLLPVLVTYDRRTGTVLGLGRHNVDLSVCLSVSPLRYFRYRPLYSSSVGGCACCGSHCRVSCLASQFTEVVHSFTTICKVKRTMSRMSNQRRWRQSPGGQLLTKYVSFQILGVQ